MDDDDVGVGEEGLLLLLAIVTGYTFSLVVVAWKVEKKGKTYQTGLLLA